MVEAPEITKKRLGAVKSKNTAAEVAVRRTLHSMGYRFRLHRSDLPGKPDMVLPKYRTVIFVHGCFWHQHPGCPMARTPKRNKPYWEEKFRRNKARDALNVKQLRDLGWRVVMVWECETHDAKKLRDKLKDILQEVEEQ